ncbi:MAG: DUF4291 domain-containing protein [Saprospiraceae bacterium]
MNFLKTIPYLEYEHDLPQTGKVILAQTKGETMYVYQAFNPQIANYAVAHQRFGGTAYSFARMSWIKPNFLWMMYRAGWASKPNQERILALEIPQQAFFDLLRAGVFSSFKAEEYTDHATWKTALANSEVRLQWDPDHNPLGEKLDRRAIQIGMKGATLQEFNEAYLQSVTDITDFVKTQAQHLKDQEKLQVIAETVLDLPLDLQKQLGILSTFA